MGPYCRSSPLLGLVFFLVTARAAVKPYITAETELYNTECKTCPHSLCTNQLAYDANETFNVTCWTRGTKIVDTTLWLKSQAGCYVTEYDTIEYEGDYTSDLAYCGPDSEDENLTLEDATLQYKTECRICPSITCDVNAYLPEDTDVTLTCWTDQGQMIIDDPYWLKTTNNCYVAEKNLYSLPDKTALDPCGPIPFLEIAQHFNENGTSEVDKRAAAPAPAPAPLATPLAAPTKRSSLTANYLINVTVGEEYAYCRSCPRETCRTEKRYSFNQEVWLQCLTLTNGTWWSETTDFCYVKNSDFWESPEGDYYRNPLCEYFGEDPSNGDN